MINIKTLVDAYVAQVDDQDFNLAADINNLQSALDALSYSALNQAGFANVQTLSGNLTLTDDSAVLQVLDPGGANRDVTLPAVANTNHPYYIVNDDPTYTLTIKNAGGTTITTVTDGLIKLVAPDGVTWQVTGTSGNLGADFVLSGVISPSQITGDQNNYSPTGLSTASTLRLSTDASRNITGLAGGAIGRVIVIHNVGSNAIVLKDESGSSTAANRFALTGDLRLVADQSIALQYDSTTSRWRLVGAPPTLLPRNIAVSPSATPTINTDLADIFTITSQNAAITSLTSGLSGNPVDGEKKEIRILDNGTARAITAGASFASGPGTLPTTTVVNKWLYIGVEWSSSRSKWICMATGSEQ